MQTKRRGGVKTKCVKRRKTIYMKNIKHRQKSVVGGRGASPHEKNTKRTERNKTKSVCLEKPDQATFLQTKLVQKLLDNFSF